MLSSYPILSATKASFLTILKCIKAAKSLPEEIQVPIQTIYFLTHGSLIKLDMQKENVWRIQLNWIVCQLSKLKATKLKTDCCRPSTDVQRQPAIAHRYLEKCFAPLLVDMWIFYIFFALLVYKNFTFERESFKNKISWVFCVFEAKKIKLLRVEKKLLHKKKTLPSVSF